MTLTDDDKDVLHDVAWHSIRYGLAHGHRIDDIRAADYSTHLNELGASFVTLHKNSDLRGCIGNLAATRALVLDVNQNANAAAFSDPRFAPLQSEELDLITLQISVLSPATEMQFASEQDLLRQLRPQVDGLILTQGAHRATFLPTVWEQLPEPENFLAHLKQKAGLAKDYWSNDIKISRYFTESF